MPPAGEPCGQRTYCEGVCDCLVALGGLTPAGVPALFAKNSDRPPGEPQRLEWNPPRRDREPVRATYVDVHPHAGETIGFLGSRPEWMWGVEHGVNAAGVAIGNEMIFTTLDPRDFPPALTGMDIVRLGLERGASAAEAVEVVTDALDRYGQGGSGHSGVDRPYWSSFLVADPSEAFVVETSGREWAVDRVQDGARAISNRTTIPEFDARHRHPDVPVEHYVEPRLRAGRALLATPPVSVARLKEHLRSHGQTDDGWDVCMHVAGTQVTTAAVVAELPPERRPLARFLLGSPCRSVFVPLHVGRPVGDPPAWDEFARLPATPSVRAALDDLERGLEADAADDDSWPDEAWRRVRKTFREVQHLGELEA